MAIPSNAAFSEYIEILNVPLGGAADFQHVARVGVNGIADLVREMRRNDDDLRMKAGALEVGRWFDANATADRAWRALFGRHLESPNPEPEELAERWIAFAFRDRTVEDYAKESEWIRSRQSCEEYLEERNTEAGKLARLTQGIRRRAMHRPYGVACDVARAFNGYFYGEAFLRYSVPPRSIKSAAADLLAAWKCLTDSAKWEAAGLEARYVRLSKIALTELETIAAGGSEPAIKKVDSTAPERALAFELWSLSRRMFRANRTTAIFNFLQFEGVKNAPDARSVERWVADWRKRRVALSPAHLAI